VTSKEDDRLNGQVINTAIQVTSEPPRVAVIINKKNLTYDYILKSGVFAISVLDESTPMKFFGPFGFRSGRAINKLDGILFKKGATGCPLLIEYCLSVLEARVFDKIDLGTHTIFVGDVLTTEMLKQGKPLTYHFYREELKGKSSKNAPTFAPLK